MAQPLRDHLYPTQVVIFNEAFRDFSSKTYINLLTNSGHSIVGLVLCLSMKLEHHKILSGELGGAKVSPRELTKLQVADRSCHNQYPAMENKYC